MMLQFVYLMSAPGHLHNLVPSLYTLRKQHPGHRVVVYAYPESYEVVRRIAQDARLDVIPKLWDPPVRYRKNCQFINKIKMLQTLDCDKVVYIDADTTIHGSLVELFEMLDHSEFVATQFSQWKSHGSVVRARLQRLFDYPLIPRAAVEYVMKHPLISVNGGVLACSPKATILPIWEQWAIEAKDIFISDEAVLHLFQVLYPEDKFTMAVGGSWNASHKYYQGDPPRVWHYHGDSNFRPDKSQQAFEFWWPIYQSCIEQNMGHIAEWHERVEYHWLTRLKGILTNESIS